MMARYSAKYAPDGKQLVLSTGQSKGGWLRCIVNAIDHFKSVISDIYGTLLRPVKLRFDPKQIATETISPELVQEIPLDQRQSCKDLGNTEHSVKEYNVPKKLKRYSVDGDAALLCLTMVRLTTTSAAARYHSLTFLTFRYHLHFFVGQSLPSSSSTVCCLLLFSRYIRTNLIVSVSGMLTFGTLWHPLV